MERRSEYEYCLEMVLMQSGRESQGCSDDDEDLCFALFEHAIEAECPLCWRQVCSRYHALVRYWVSLRISASSDVLDDLTQDAFTAFWRFYTIEKLSEADRLRDILAYLKSCAFSAVNQRFRKQQRQVPETDLDRALLCQEGSYSTESRVMEQLRAEDIWSIIAEQCQDRCEEIVAYCMLLQDWKPRQVAERFEETFHDVKDVYRVKYNLVSRLRRDPKLNAIYERY